MPFHSMTTTDSVESINGGLAKSLSEVLNPPTSSPIHVVLRQLPCACVSRPLRDVTAEPGRANRPSTRHATFRVEDGVYSSRLHLIRAVRLSHERMGQSITSIRAHGGPSSAGFALASVWHLAPNRYCVAIDVLMPFHSITTTDSVESINGGLGESPSEVLNPPCSSLTAAGSRV